MKANFSLVFMGFILCLTACNGVSSGGNQIGNAQSASKETASGNKADDSSVGKTPSNTEVNNSGKTETAESQNKQPKTAREFYLAMPSKYLNFDQCDTETDKNCKKYREEYLRIREYTEDIENGYLQTGGENADPTITITLFKRPDDSYLVGVSTANTADDKSHFLNYDNGNWNDVSEKVVPQFSNKTKSYELPRYGTTVKVVAKTMNEDNFADYGDKLYDLEWKDGKFTIKK